jgi:phosphatidylglycerol---prolipoprotein diacylglyceryl transferase
MINFLIPFPNISNEIINIYGPLSIRWYGLGYLFAMMSVVFFLKKRLETIQETIHLSQNIYETIGLPMFMFLVLGGRIGYILFYDPAGYISNPLKIFRVWEGGMSFHGGVLGFISGVIYLSKKNKVSFFSISDSIASAMPIGLFFGRLGNFCGGELYGRATDVPWAMIFPNANDDIPRHPSQIYEAIIEGLILFLITSYFFKKKKELPGYTSGVFLIGYGIGRYIVEFFREPDALWSIDPYLFSKGQALCVPMIMLGVFIVYRSFRVSSR